MAAPNTLLLYWLQAQAEPLGLGLRTSDPTRLKQLLYSARAKATEPLRSELAQMSIRTAPDEPECVLWIVKSPPKSVNMGPPSVALEAPDGS